MYDRIRLGRYYNFNIEITNQYNSIFSHFADVTITMTYTYSVFPIRVRNSLCISFFFFATELIFIHRIKCREKCKYYKNTYE